MSTPGEIADCLERAADLIEVHGWGQGVRSARLNQSTLCAMHAINVALGHEVDTDRLSTEAVCPAGEAAEKAMVDAGYGSPSGRFGSHLWSWNDDADRNEFEVIDALRLTAKSLRPVELPDPHEASALMSEWLQEKAER